MKNRLMSIAPLATLAALSILSPAGVFAADYSWNGSGNGVWGAPANWLVGGSAPVAAPGSGDKIITPTQTTNSSLGSANGSRTISAWDYNSSSTWSNLVATNGVSFALTVTDAFTVSGGGRLHFRNANGFITLNLNTVSVTGTGSSIAFGGATSGNANFGVIDAFTANSMSVGIGTSVDFAVSGGAATISGALATDGIISVRATNSADVSGTLSVGSLTGSGTIQANNNSGSANSIGTLELKNASGSATFTGVIKNGGTSTAGVNNRIHVTKSGAGTQIFTGTNTYSGATTITGGTLAINGAGSINTTSGITINGGTFRYNSSVNLSAPITFTSGTIGGTNLSGVALSIGTNQTLSPANSTGTMSAGATTFANGGTYEFELNDAAGTAGSSSAGWDLLNASTITFTATTGQFNLTLISLTSGQVAGLAQNFNSATNYKWLFADAGSTITSFTGSEITVNTSGFQNSLTGTFSVVRGDASGIGGDDSQLYLVYTAGVIPEPSTYAVLAGLGVLTFAVGRNRRVKLG